MYGTALNTLPSVPSLIILISIFKILSRMLFTCTAELPLNSSEMEVSKTEVQSQPLTGRIIKLMFQRKRKRGATIDGSGSSEMIQ